MVRLILFLIVQSAVHISPAIAQWAPYYQIVEDCTAVDKSGADYFTLSRGDSTTFHGFDEKYATLNPVGNWDKVRRSGNEFDDPRGRIPLKYVVGRPESLDFVKELLNREPNDPWLLYCLAEARFSILNHSTKPIRSVLYLADVPPSFSTASEFLATQIRELHEIRELLTKIERLERESGEVNSNVFKFANGRVYFLFYQSVISMLLDYESRQKGELIRRQLERPENHDGYFYKAYAEWIEWHVKSLSQNPYSRGEVDVASQERISRLFKDRIERTDVPNQTISERGQFVDLYVHLNRYVFARKTPDDLRGYLSLYSELISEVDAPKWIYERAKLYVQLNEFDAARADLALYLNAHGDKAEHEKLLEQISGMETR